METKGENKMDLDLNDTPAPESAIPVERDFGSIVDEINKPDAAEEIKANPPENPPVTTEAEAEINFDDIASVADISEPTVEPTPIKVNPDVTVNAANRGFVAVSETLENAGITTWYEQSGDTSVEALNYHLTEAGFGSLIPAEPSTKDCLTRTASDWKEKGKAVVRTKGGAYCLYEAEGKETGNGDVDLDTRKACVLTVVDDKLVVNPPDHPRAEEFRKRFEHFRTHYNTADMALWLKQVANKLKAVPLKSRGQIYYVPPVNMEKWKQLAQAVVMAAENRHEFSFMPTMKTADAIQAIFRAVKKEAEEIVAEVQAEMAEEKKESGKKMNIRGIRTRIINLDTALDKVKAYEKILEVEMPDLKATLLNLKNELDKRADETAQRGARLEID